jgi:hypothetical protein
LPAACIGGATTPLFSRSSRVELGDGDSSARARVAVARGRATARAGPFVDGADRDG